MLYFIGLGLYPKHLTLEAIDALRRLDKAYIDTYTSIIPGFDKSIIENLVPGEVVEASRSMLEGESITRIVEEARDKNVGIITPGDPFIATTHDAIRIEALKKKIPVKTIHGITIYSLAASATGLQAYRFGKTVTLVYPEAFKPISTIQAIHDNLDRGLHTLLLLDLRLEENRVMTIPEAVEILLDLDERGILGETIAVGAARLGTPGQTIVADRLHSLGDYDYPPPPHSIIVVAKPHPVELEALHYLAGLPYKLYKRYERSRGYP